MRQRSVNAPYTITTVFGNVEGYPLNNGFHTGVDYVSSDDLIVAPQDSIVTALGYDKTNGNYLVLEKDGYRDWFSHTSKYLVKKGDSVVRGQPIAVQGDTGSADGVHNHHSLRVNGVLVDPEQHISKGETMDLNLARQQADAQWGWNISPERDAILNRDIVGRETNEAINFMYNHEWGVNWRTYRNQLQQFWNDYHEKIVSGKLDDDDAEMQAALVELNKAKELIEKAIAD